MCSSKNTCPSFVVYEMAMGYSLINDIKTDFTICDLQETSSKTLTHLADIVLLLPHLPDWVEHRWDDSEATL